MDPSSRDAEACWPSIRDWLETWAGLVRAVDYAAARRLFCDDVVAFGTQTPVMRGLDELVERQWKAIWPHSDGFHFELDHAAATVDASRRMACVMSPWTSTGYGERGEAFDRPGRATIVLTRDAVDQPWRASHTHLSLRADVPRTTRLDPPKPEAR